MSVIYDYPGNVQATFIGSQMTPRFYRSNHERYIGENGFIRNGARILDLQRRSRPGHRENQDRISRSIRCRRLSAASQKGNRKTRVRGAESTLTCILDKWLSISGAKYVGRDDEVRLMRNLEC